ncbi:transposase, partial [bacterium]|nr:transposase [bacterium]
MAQLAPHILDRESDPRVLRDLAKLLDAENKRLRAVLEKALAEQAKEAQAKLNIEESLQVLKKKYFGKSSEKSVSSRNRDRMNEDAEVLLHSQNLLPPPRNIKSKDLESEDVYHSASDEDLKSMSESLELENPSADQWEEVQGLFDTTTEITVIERQYKKVVHKRKKYKLKKKFSIAEKEVLVSAPGAVKFVPGSSYSIEFATSVVVDKYLNHIPLERQTRMMASLGLKDMHTKVLYNLSRLASVYLEEVTERIKKEVLSIAMIHSDETRWPINNKKDSDGYMW